MIEIKLLKTITGEELNQEYMEKYGSIQELERKLEADENNMKLYSDLEDWKFFSQHPDEQIEDTTTILTDALRLTTFELELLNFIKNEIRNQYEN